jgi:Beta-galactosidase/Beta-galactosidase trimerisation domain
MLGARFRGPVAALSLAALVPALSVGAQGATDWSDRWDRFTMLVWQYQTPPPGPGAKAAYDSVNLHGIHLDNGFPDALLDFAKANNYAYYVDHAAGKGYLYLRPGEWDTFASAYKASRQRPVRPHCLRDPQVVQSMKDLLRENITRARTGRALGYAFDDEISLTSFTSPADVCWCPRCLEAFRAWLQTEYGTIEALNTEWGTTYQGFGQAEPLHVDDLRSAHGQPFDQWNLARWADHRSFMDSTFADVLADLVRYANSLDPSTPAGFVGGQAPAAYGGYDYAKLCEAVQWMEAYDIGATNEILRSFFGQRRPHVQTYFSNYDPACDRWFLWYYLVHGNRGVICWPDRDGQPWFVGGRARPEIAALAPTYGELQGDLGGLLVGARFLHDRVAVYYSQPSIQVSWFMDIAPHGSTWVNRSSSLNNESATDIINRWAWLKLLEDCGCQYEFVSYRDVAAGRLATEGYAALILPRTLALSDAEAATIRRFAESGGTVIADYLPGTFDEHGKGRPRGALDELFGVARDPGQGVLDGKQIAEVNGELYERPLAERLSHAGARRQQGFVVYERGLRTTTAIAQGDAEGTAMFAERAAGPGRAAYLNVSLIPYLLFRYGAGGAPYRERLSALLASAGVRPQVRIFEGDAELCNMERLWWERDGRRYLCLMWNALPNARIDGVGISLSVIGGPARTIILRFAEPVRGLRNLRSGQALGDGSEFTDTWLPCEANLYEVGPVHPSGDERGRGR